MTRKNPLRALREGKKGLRVAVDAKCWECMGGEEKGVSREVSSLIRECTSPRCPLYAVRPYR